MILRFLVLDCSSFFWFLFSFHLEVDVVVERRRRGGGGGEGIINGSKKQGFISVV